MATHSSILAWRISWTEEPDQLQFMGPKRVRMTVTDTHTHISCNISFKTLCEVKDTRYKIPSIV